MNLESLTVDELKEQIIEQAKDWVRQYGAIESGESEAEYSDVDHDHMIDVFDYARELLEREG